MDMERLGGGVANAGAVTRWGDRVRRPLPSNAPTLHRLLRHVRESSDVLVPMPFGTEHDLEVLEFLPGDVAVAPYPAWANSIEALDSIGRLLRRFHDATIGWDVPADAVWSSELADPTPGPVICHNDVCIENVVFHTGRASALIDFDFAAPGRPVWDVVHTARYWVPLTDPALPAASSRRITDPIRRLRYLVDAYGLDDLARSDFVEIVLEAEHAARRFVERQVELGTESFVEMWSDDARQRFDAKIAWIESHASAITATLQ